MKTMNFGSSNFIAAPSSNASNWFKLQLITYNVGTSNPTSDFYDLLSLNKSVSKSDCPDLILVSLQEVDSKILKYAVDLIYDDPWTNRFSIILEVWDYVKVKTIRLQGLVLNLFCLRKHLPHLRNIDVEFTKTGLFGVWGNKGAVSIRFDINGTSLCFLNAHLAAHETKLDDRIDDYNDILKSHKFHVKQTTIFSHDYVFWMGDLNFRLLDDFEISFDEILELIQKNDFKVLFEQDELRHVMENDRAFSEFSEIEPEFPPTFKFEVGTSNYDEKRKPAWTDRILYALKSNTDSDSKLNINLKNIFYKSHPNYMQSDHKPVSAMFEIKVMEEKVNEVVIFENISQWLLDGDNEVVYKITISSHAYPNKWDEYEDWIGLFQDGFTSLDDYLSYVYTDTISELVSRDKSFLYFSVKFTDSQIRKVEYYCIFCCDEQNDVLVQHGTNLKCLRNKSYDLLSNFKCYNGGYFIYNYPNTSDYKSCEAFAFVEGNMHNAQSVLYRCHEMNLLISNIFQICILFMFVVIYIILFIQFSGNVFELSLLVFFFFIIILEIFKFSQLNFIKYNSFAIGIYSDILHIYLRLNIIYFAFLTSIVLYLQFTNNVVFLNYFEGFLLHIIKYMSFISIVLLNILVIFTYGLNLLSYWDVILVYFKRNDIFVDAVGIIKFPYISVSVVNAFICYKIFKLYVLRNENTSFKDRAKVLNILLILTNTHLLIDTCLMYIVDINHWYFMLKNILCIKWFLLSLKIINWSEFLRKLDITPLYDFDSNQIDLSLDFRHIG